MANRLAKQAFETFFSDLPTELAALIGSPTLAEIKVLPGRDSVRAQSADECATSDIGMKNAHIEANTDETQTDKPQNDRAHNPDSGGEKRSQPRDEDFFGHV
jgi:hypothetical protein